MPRISLIIPCYNEEENIKLLFSQILKLKTKINLEVIIINNGSIDNTRKKILIYKKKIRGIKIVNIKKNIGFGNGVKKGIKKASSDIICYTHGDLQISLDSVLKAYKIYVAQKSKNILVKGTRRSRPFVDIFFTLLMSLFNTFLFRKFLFDIHAQPNLFNKYLIKNIKFLPDDMSIDLYIILCAKIKKYNILRFKVNFLKREFGIGSNDTLIKKVKYSLLSLFCSLRIFLNGRY